MSVEHSFYAVYGVELAEADWWVVDEGLTRLRHTRPTDDEAEDVQLYTISGNGGPERVVIGVTSEELPPGTCRPAGDFTGSVDRDEVLRRAVDFLNCHAVAEPGWLLVHDFS
ncbi:hypothetical protein ACIQU4_27515 [Streptomyces sp. NPDC090741]|uniref:hypothetical protein n=1 Tax=Streptomyces sp. NPDC090741 TaxID=3365967 RepID=UPI0037F29B45